MLKILNLLPFPIWNTWPKRCQSRSIQRGLNFTWIFLFPFLNIRCFPAVYLKTTVANCILLLSSSDDIGCWPSNSVTECTGKPQAYSSHVQVQPCAWWRHQMETFSALLAICAGNSPVPGEFPAQRPVTRSFDVFFDLRLNKRLSKQSWGWWFEALSCPVWRHRNGQEILRFTAYLLDYGCTANVPCNYGFWFLYQCGQHSKMPHEGKKQFFSLKGNVETKKASHVLTRFVIVLIKGQGMSSNRSSNCLFSSCLG